MTDVEVYSHLPFTKRSSYAAAVNKPNESFHLDELNLGDCYVSPLHKALGSMAGDTHWGNTPPTQFGIANI